MKKEAELHILSEQLLKEYVTAVTSVTVLFFLDASCQLCIIIRLSTDSLMEMSTGLDTGIHSLIPRSDIQSNSHLYSEKAWF